MESSLQPSPHIANSTTTAESRLQTPADDTGSMSTASFQKEAPAAQSEDAIAPSSSKPASFLRRHWKLISAALITVVVIALVVGLAVPLTLRHKHHSHTTASAQSTSTIPRHTATNTAPSSPTSTNDPLSFQFSRPPVRLGLLTNFPDPTIYYDSSSKTWYALGTNDAAGILSGQSSVDPSNPATYAQALSNLQIATSPDFEQWTLLDASSDPLPTPGSWVQQGKGSPTQLHTSHTSHTGTATRPTNSAAAASISVSLANVWAPDMIQHPVSGNWLLYYAAAASSAPLHHCVGAASATAAGGPFTAAPTPLACPLAEGGAIDPVGFVEPSNASVYVVYKVDGNSIGHGGECGNTIAPLAATPIRLQKMLGDGISPDTSVPPVTLLDRAPQDGPLIEAPALAKVGNTYYLFYSSGCTRNPDYTVRYATASALGGPYTRVAAPLFKTGDYDLLAPGSVSVRYAPAANESETTSVGRSGWRIALHGRVPTNIGGVRALFTAGLDFAANGTVSLVDGSRSVV